MCYKTKGDLDMIHIFVQKSLFKSVVDIIIIQSTTIVMTNGNNQAGETDLVFLGVAL